MRNLPRVPLIGCLLLYGLSFTMVPAEADDPGALLSVTMQSRVGVLLDEGLGTMRDRTAQLLVSQSAAFWTQRARMQLEYTLYRLYSRHYFYEGQNKYQLPLPPSDKWTIRLSGSPIRAIIDDHDLVVVDYTFTGVLLSDTESPGKAEPALAVSGGQWAEPFILPVDPDLLLQRTGYACIDESNYPPNSADEENAHYFYNQECRVETPDTLSCHQTTPLPTMSCVEALKQFIGQVVTSLRFTRLPWDPALADRTRTGSTAAPDSADLAVVASGLDNHRLVYRYIEPDSCALQERCVGGPGWRRLLEFDARIQNIGGQDLKLGNVQSLTLYNLFEYSACHHHYHFRHYGTFTLDAGQQAIGQKQAFCLQSTSRDLNNEQTPLISPYTACQYQGITAGWGDTYLAGLECQWIDVTALPPTEMARLTFAVNPDQFLCEGTPVLDTSGQPTFETTTYQTEDGRPEQRPVCNFGRDWNANNTAATMIPLSQNEDVATQPCDRGQIGPRRNCGFQVQQDNVSCQPGQPVTLSCTASPSGVIRFCEASAVLGYGIPCTYRQALANEPVNTTTTVSFTCPVARSVQEPGGHYAVYAAPMLSQDAAVAVTCTPR